MELKIAPISDQVVNKIMANEGGSYFSDAPF